MANFPTLSRQPAVGGLTEATEDDVLYQRAEAGPDVTRTSVTRPYREFQLRWQGLTATDVANLRTWWTSYRAAYTTWTHPDATTWEVRPKGPPQITANPALGVYEVSLVLRGYQNA
jgi:hypothetical protein